MVTLAQKIAYLYPNALALRDYSVADQGAGQFIGFWKTEVLGAQPTQAQLDAVTDAVFDADTLTKAYTRAKALISADDDVSRKEKGAFLVLLDALNRQSRQYRDLLAAIAAANSLANLQTRVAAIAPVEPARTSAEFRTAIANKIDAGEANG